MLTTMTGDVDVDVHVRVTLQRDCFGGGRLVDIELGRPVDESMLARLSGVGSKQILRDLPKPFFRFDVPGRFLVSGILGESRVRFTVRLALKDQAERVATEAAIAMLTSVENGSAG